jgi:divalent metal cation (Fe/Co/Zn/Cd) transporter
MPEALHRRSDRHSLLESALRLSLFTIGWNGVVGAVGLGAAVVAGSLALAAFALNALVDSAASAVLVWRFHKERRDPEAAEHLERRAQTGIILAMLVVALYVGVRAVLALAGGAHAEPSILGAVIAGVSVVVLPFLGRRKLDVAARLPSPALRGDGILTLAAAALAGVTLLAQLLNAALDWWWADPAAALMIAITLAVEAVRVAVRHRFG